MIIEIGRFYKYKGPTYISFTYDEVYKMKAHGHDEYVFEDYKGGIHYYEGNIEDVFISSGVQEVNWRNKDNKKNKGEIVQSEPVKYVHDTPMPMKSIPAYLFDKLAYLGIIDQSGVRLNNVGKSNYSEHLIQPWSVWLDYPTLTSWDHDIIKRVLRTKKDTPRAEDYEKIIHICQERLRQLSCLS